MTIKSPKKEITEYQLEDVRKRNPNDFWHPRFVTMGPVPPDQKYAVITVALNPAVTAEDHDIIVTAIEEITGIQQAIVNIYGKTPPASSIPTDHNVYFTVRGGYAFKTISPSPSMSPSISFSISPSLSISISPSPLP